MKLNETSEIWGSSESGHKMAVFWDIMSGEEFTIQMMEAVVSSEILYMCTSVHGIAYKQT